MGDIPITWVRSAVALIFVAANLDTSGSMAGVLHTLATTVVSQARDVAALLHAMWMHTTLRVWMMDIWVHLLLPNVCWTDRKMKRSRIVGSRKFPVQNLKRTIRVVWPGMEDGTSVSRINNPTSSLWLRMDTTIVFVPLTVGLLTRTRINWVTTIHFWNITGKNAEALYPKCIVNVRRLIVTFGTVTAHLANKLDAMTENVANYQSRQQNVRVKMCQVKNLFQLFWIVINWPMKKH